MRSPDIATPEAPTNAAIQVQDAAAPEVVARPPDEFATAHLRFTGGEPRVINNYPPVPDPSFLRVDAAETTRTVAMVAAIRRDTKIDRPLEGKKFAVITESLFVPQEQKAYADMIRELGGEVIFATKVWHWYGATSAEVTSHGEGSSTEYTDIQSFPITNDIMRDVVGRLGEFSGVILSANYTMMRLLHPQPPNEDNVIQTAQNMDELMAGVQRDELAQLVAAIMEKPDLIKAFCCHSIWALTTHPEYVNGSHPLYPNGVTMAFNGVMSTTAKLLNLKLAPNDQPDIHQHAYSDIGTNIVSSAAGVFGGPQAIVREVVMTALRNEGRLPESATA